MKFLNTLALLAALLGAVPIPLVFAEEGPSGGPADLDAWTDPPQLRQSQHPADSKGKKGQIPVFTEFPGTTDTATSTSTATLTSLSGVDPSVLGLAQGAGPQGATVRYGAATGVGTSVSTAQSPGSGYDNGSGQACYGPVSGGAPICAPLSGFTLALRATTMGDGNGKLLIEGGGDENTQSWTRNGVLRLCRPGYTDAYCNEIWSATGSSAVEWTHSIQFWIAKGDGSTKQLGLSITGDYLRAPTGLLVGGDTYGELPGQPGYLGVYRLHANATDGLQWYFNSIPYADSSVHPSVNDIPGWRLSLGGSADKLVLARAPGVPTANPQVFADKLFVTPTAVTPATAGGMALGSSSLPFGRLSLLGETATQHHPALDIYEGATKVLSVQAANTVYGTLIQFLASGGFDFLNYRFFGADGTYGVKWQTKGTGAGVDRFTISGNTAIAAVAFPNSNVDIPNGSLTGRDFVTVPTGIGQFCKTTTGNKLDPSCVPDVGSGVYIPLTQKGSANGVATLGSDGILSASQRPPSGYTCSGTCTTGVLSAFAGAGALEPSPISFNGANTNVSQYLTVGSGLNVGLWVNASNIDYDGNTTGHAAGDIPTGTGSANAYVTGRRVLADVEASNGGSVSMSNSVWQTLTSYSMTIGSGQRVALSTHVVATCSSAGQLFQTMVQVDAGSGPTDLVGALAGVTPVSNSSYYGAHYITLDSQKRYSTAGSVTFYLKATSDSNCNPGNSCTPTCTVNAGNGLLFVQLLSADSGN